MERRAFIQQGLLMAGGLSTLGCPPLPKVTPKNKTMGTLFLKGGLDPLACVLPKNSPQFEKLKTLRPHLIFSGGLPLPGNDNWQINPVLKSLQGIIAEGGASIILGADTGRDSFSHFGQMEYLNSGGASSSQATGFYGRALKAMNMKSDKIAALNMGSIFHSDLRGKHFVLPGEFLDEGSKRYFAMFEGEDGIFSGDCSQLESHKYLSEICNNKDLLLKNRQLIEKIQEFQPPKTYASKNSLEKWFLLLEKSLRVYKKAPFFSLQMTGWDTHFSQVNILNKLLSQIDQAIGKFYSHYLKTEEGKDCLLIVTSEFGRRISENSSKGTEHGYGGISFVIGHPSNINTKFVFPSADELFNGEYITRKYPIFDIYGDLFERHIGLTASQVNNIFPNHKYKSMGLIS